MASECPIDVRFFSAPADLSPCFTSIYHLTVKLPAGERVTDLLLPEWANLRFFTDTDAGPDTPSLRSAGAQRFQATGPSSYPTRFEIGRTRMWGLGLSPLGWARYVARDAGDFVNVGVDGEADEAFAAFRPLCDILCAGNGSLEGQLAEAMDYMRGAARLPEEADRILAVHEAMADPYLTQVDDFAAKLGISKRTLERVCKRHFGFSPRVLLRRQRLVRTLATFMLERGSWTSVIDRHYHDQAHFVHEFKTFMGMSPTEYAELAHPILSAFMAERRRIWGSPVQARPKRR